MPYTLPALDYAYDALYRLIQAQGRESIGLASQPQTTWDDSPRMGQTLPLPANAQALRNYTESYQYDSVGNVTQQIDGVGNTNAPGVWLQAVTDGVVLL